jgi:hypothetical protein
MAVITKLIVEQAARSMVSFLTNVTPETKKGNHPILLTGGVDVEVELKAGVEDKIIIIGKVANCVVYREKMTFIQLDEIKNDTESLYVNLLQRTIESLYDDAMLRGFSLTPLINAVENRHLRTTTLNLPAGFSVEIKPDTIFIFDHKNEQVELRDIINGNFALAPTLCIPKSIVSYMIANDFKPFLI